METRTRIVPFTTLVAALRGDTNLFPGAITASTDGDGTGKKQRINLGREAAVLARRTDGSYMVLPAGSEGQLEADDRTTFVVSVQAIGNNAVAITTAGGSNPLPDVELRAIAHACAVYAEACKCDLSEVPAFRHFAPWSSPARCAIVETDGDSQVIRLDELPFLAGRTLASLEVKTDGETAYLTAITTDGMALTSDKFPVDGIFAGSLQEAEFHTCTIPAGVTATAIEVVDATTDGDEQRLLTATADGLFMGNQIIDGTRGVAFQGLQSTRGLEAVSAFAKAAYYAVTGDGRIALVEFDGDKVTVRYLGAKTKDAPMTALAISPIDRSGYGATWSMDGSSIRLDQRRIELPALQG